MSQLTFPYPMDPKETRVLTFDATADLETGETLTSILSTTVTVQRGKDANASAIISSSVINSTSETLTVNNQSVTIAASKCVQSVVTNPVDGVWYEIAHLCATTNPDKKPVLKAILQVTSQA